jgi:hypothetical protein
MKYLGIALVIVFILSLAIFFTIKDSSRNARFRDEYKNVTKADSFFGNITEMHTNKGISYVTINSKEKYLLDISRNENYHDINVYLSKMLAIGDSLVKKNESDSLIIYKGGEIYYFLLGEIIEKR